MLAATLALCITSCSDDKSGEKGAGDESPVLVAARQAADAHLDSQYQILRDGQVTSAEYKDSLDAMISCLETGGISVTDPVLDISDNLQYSYNLTIQPGVQQAGSDKLQSTCHRQWMGLVEEQYQATHKPEMDPALLSGVMDCLKGMGVKLSGKETNIPELQGSPGKATGDQLNVCIPKVGAQLYPGQSIPFNYIPS